MITLDEAQRIAHAYADERGAIWLNKAVIDRQTYWFFPVGYVGSCGVIIDKADGRLSILGSALPLDACFWGHEHGFSPEFVTLRVTKVHDRRRAIEFLLNVVREGPPRRRNPNPRRAWLGEQLDALPCEFGPQRLWLWIPEFRQVTAEGWFDYEILEPSAG